MSINDSRWIKTLSITNIESDHNKYKLDTSRWINTIPKINPKIKKNNLFKEYSLTAILFIVGITFVSLIKNETRNLQKEINNLRTSINILNFDLHQATLDHEVITSPENISQLAKEYLESNFISYTKTQIKQLNESEKNFTILKEKKHKKTFKNKDLSKDIKMHVAKKIEVKKDELKKLQEFYYEPRKLPIEIKMQIARKIDEKKKELKKFYNTPKDSIYSGKIVRWTAFQVVKAFLGIPTIPGK